MRLLRRVALVLVLVGNAHPLRAQMETLDLSDSPIATVVPAEYDGGFFARIGDIVVNELGIWVTDVGHLRVLWFDESGSLIAEFGREGSGPGEFVSPSIVSIDSVLTVDDFRQGRRVRFRLDGTHIETKRGRHFADPDGSEVALRDAVTLVGGHTVGMIPASYTISFSRNVVNDLRNKVVLLNRGGESADTLFSYHWGLAGWKTEITGSATSTHFGAAGAWSVLGDTAVALADGVAGTLTIGKPEIGSVRADTIDLGFAGRSVTERDLADLEADIRDRSSRDLPRRMEIDAPGYWSVATRLIPATDEVFWLRQAVEGEQQVWVVVKPETREQWRVILPARFALTVIYGGRLFGVARDELDVPSVGAIDDPRPPT